MMACLLFAEGDAESGLESRDAEDFLVASEEEMESEDDDERQSPCNGRNGQQLK